MIFHKDSINAWQYDNFGIEKLRLGVNTSHGLHDW